ncbi:MAG: LytTR family DNA-binding domain-containing protein [Clostridiales bacterium]|nr:LytTR family transcriptional regulator [Roseburia sp.]MDD7637899.1 LytTR family DNA-binding domain-containing protein [Clostridiales bacterium]MDY4112890.1 LytTR family DNA-binding domain-containing protein [Roseburia sp.]
MKIRIEIDEGMAEDEVIIRCRGLTEEVTAVQKAVSDVVNASQRFPFYKGNTEYYLALDEILFFETDDSGISAHTKKEMYQTKYKLYELEDILPGVFMRVSKSTILNTRHIYSISRNLTASSVVAFEGTHKQVYVSRYYYKPLISKLEEKRLKHEK